MPSEITGQFRSTYSAPLDAWHLAQKFTALPTLNETFILEATDAVVRRAVALGAAVNGAQFLMDAFFDVNAVRPMPMYGVPGLVDHL